MGVQPSLYRIPLQTSFSQDTTVVTSYSYQSNWQLATGTRVTGSGWDVEGIRKCGRCHIGSKPWLIKPYKTALPGWESHGVCTGAGKTNSQSKECVSPRFFSVDVTYLPLNFHRLSLIAQAGNPLPGLL